MNNIRSHWLCYILGAACYVAALGIARQSILLSQVYTLSQIGNTPEAIGSSWNLSIMYTVIESVAMTPVLTPLLWEKLAKEQSKYNQTPKDARKFSDWFLVVSGFLLVGGIVWAYYSDIASVWGTLSLGSGDSFTYAVGLTLAHVFGSEVLTLLGGISFWAGKTIQDETAESRTDQEIRIESARLRKQATLQKQRQQVESRNNSRNNGSAPATSHWGV